LGTWQEDAIRNITGYLGGANYGQDESGAFYREQNIGAVRGGMPNSSTQYTRTFFDASHVVPTANENRVRNVAYPAYIYAGRPA
jgi:hypothetical protein